MVTTRRLARHRGDVNDEVVSRGVDAVRDMFLLTAVPVRESQTGA